MDEYTEQCTHDHTGVVFIEYLGKNNEFLTEYKKLETDEERFSLALGKIVQNSQLQLDHECGQKSNEESTTARLAGNSSFKSSQYLKAVIEYTASILRAVDSSEDLALAYANRSAALFKLEKYQNCIEDIDRALELKYPDKLKMKLHKRKGMCLQKLGLPGAESSFQEAELWLEKMTLSKSDIDEMKNELKELIKAPSAVAKPKEQDRRYLSPEILTPNSEIPSASDAIALKYSKKWGRQFVATRKIKPGELLVLEKPYCMRLLTQNLYKYCSYCLQVCFNLIPCRHCIRVAYCSKACEDKAWEEYHEVECPIIGHLIAYKPNGMLWMSLRTTIVATQKGTKLDALKQELQSVDSNPDSRTKGFCADEKFHSDQYRSIHSLSTNVDLNSGACIFGTLWVGITICLLAQETEFFGKMLRLHELTKNPDVIYLGGLMLKHVHIYHTNRHGFGAPKTPETQEHGHVVMAASSLFNHSCNPNTCRQWLPGRLVMYATMPIEEGEQILDNYGPHYTTQGLRERQMALMSRNIKCMCVACTKEWPLLDDLPSYKRQILTSENEKVLDKVLSEFVKAQGNLMVKEILEYGIESLNPVELVSFMLKGIQGNVPELLKELSKIIEIQFMYTKKPCYELALAVGMVHNLYFLIDGTIFKYSPFDQFTPESSYLGLYMRLMGLINEM